MTKEASRLLLPLTDLFATLQGKRVAIGLSGGVDSAMLAVCATELASQYKITLSFIHVHHGLMPEADEWVEECLTLAKLLDVPCFIERVKVDTSSGLGIEGAAREARYQAYYHFAKEQQVSHFLLAHHLNDQAETVLLRLLRGSGVLGMRGMLSHIQKKEISFYRPWLGVDRAVILKVAEGFTQQYQWKPVQDSSNMDSRYKRGAIRQYLSPYLNQFWPSWKQNLSRHARLMQEMQQLADDMAKIDFDGLDIKDNQHSFCLKAWRMLPPYRQSNVLRYWLSLFQLAMPSENRLKEWLKQLREVHQLGFDREVKLPHEGWVILIKKGRVIIVADQYSSVTFQK